MTKTPEATTNKGKGVEIYILKDKGRQYLGEAENEIWIATERRHDEGRLASSGTRCLRMAISHFV